MLELHSILVPVDFSERSTAAAEHAVAMADRFRSQLIFLHVLAPGPYEYGGFEGGYYPAGVWPSESDIEAEFRRQLEALVEKVAPGRGVEKLLLKGNAARRIEEAVKQKKVDMVIVPTHGYGPFRRFILGSVAAKLLHDISCPVLTGAHVPEIPATAEPYRRVACAVDLREHSETVLRWAWEFSQRWEADLTVIHAAPSLEITMRYGEVIPPESRQLLIQAAKEGLGKLIREVGCKAEAHVDSADVTYYVPQVEKETRADILVIGRHREVGLLGRLGAHAYALIRESPCPVISI